MALIKCTECGSEISDKAAACVKCGAPVPAHAPAAAAVIPPASLNQNGNWTHLALAAAVVIGGIWYEATKDDDAPAASPEKSTAACRADLQCWGDKGISAASVFCREPIERLAAHSVKWTDGTFESKFSRFRWLDQAAGTITFIGDRAEFQNGFGAYTPVTYACDLADLDKQTPKVLDVRIVTEGRLPK